MNIFKILSSGDQKIKEPAVTSFLAYLLDPKESHGLGSSFLELFLRNTLEKDNKRELYDCFFFKKNNDQIIHNNFLRRFNDISVEIEKSVWLVENESKKRKRKDIDIQIRITTEKRIYFFYIENKINDGAINSSKNDQNQLFDQVQGVLNEIVSNQEDNIDDDNNTSLRKQGVITTIFLTPESTISERYYDAFTNKLKNEETEYKNILTNKILWKTDTENHHTVYSIFKTILENESCGIIEPINDNTKHTIKAFMNFIKSDFKSLEEENDESGLGQKEYLNNIEELLKIWNCNDNDKGRFLREIIDQLKDKDPEVKFTKGHISIKNNKKNIAIIRKNLSAQVKPSTKNENVDFQISKDGKWMDVDLTTTNVAEFIGKVKNLIEV